MISSVLGFGVTGWRSAFASRIRLRSASVPSSKLAQPSSDGRLIIRSSADVFHELSQSRIRFGLIMAAAGIPNYGVESILQESADTSMNLSLSF